jgi:hypothetical protein
LEPSAYIDFLALLEHSSSARVIRQSTYLYPAIEVVHITGIVILVGAALLFDLRLLGYKNEQSVYRLSLYLLPVSRKGLLLIIPSGILLFITNAKALGLDPVFWIKMILLLIAALNVFVFHRFIFRSAVLADDNKKLPSSARISAAVSILAWISMIVCGRLLAY